MTPKPVARSYARSDSDCPRPSRQMPSARRETMARMRPTPIAMADPLIHSEMNAEYHGAPCPPGSQFAIGRTPKIAPSAANATANHRERNRGNAAVFWLAKREELGKAAAALLTALSTAMRRRCRKRLGLGRRCVSRRNSALPLHLDHEVL